MQGGEAALAHARDLAQLCAEQGALAAAEEFLFAAGRGADSVGLWMGEGMWTQAHAAAVLADMPQAALQVQQPRACILATPTWLSTSCKCRSNHLQHSNFQ